MESQNLEHIAGRRLDEIAEKAGVSREYVRLLVKGKRKKNTVRAKKILKAANALNAAIKKGLDKVDQLVEKKASK